MSYVRTWGKSGKDAYRVAFNMIGGDCPRMTADYRSIESVGGKEMLDYVIENPKELISTYNRLYDEKAMNFEPFSEEFTKKWRENL